MAKHYMANGIVDPIKPAAKKFTLKELQTLVGGDIQIIRGLKGGMKMIVNSDGVPLHLPENDRATERLQLESKTPVVTLVGDVVLVERGEF